MTLYYLQWHMVTVVHVYNRWTKSELRVYVDGNLESHSEMSWLVNTSDVSKSQLSVCQLHMKLILKFLVVFNTRHG